MEPGFPLVDYAMNLVHEQNSRTTKEDANKARAIFESYVSGRATFTEAAGQMRKTMADCSPLEIMRKILECDEVPIPTAKQSMEKEDMGSGQAIIRRKTKTWTTEEDFRLLMAVHKYGTENWNAISNYVGFGRNRSQVSQRWSRCIDPRVSKGAWSEEEDQRLTKLVKIYGEKSWIKVAKALGNRSDVQCRYRASLIGAAGAHKSADDKSSEKEPKEQLTTEKKQECLDVLFSSAEMDSILGPNMPSAPLFGNVGADVLADPIFWAL